jgi:hypothetical protein
MRAIHVARKPPEETLAKNAVAWGTGGLNIGTSRIPYQAGVKEPNLRWGHAEKEYGSRGVTGWKQGAGVSEPDNKGRYPANVLFIGGAHAALDAQEGGVSRYFKVFL